LVAAASDEIIALRGQGLGIEAIAHETKVSVGSVFNVLNKWRKK
jgi:hypothetical protein